MSGNRFLVSICLVGWAAVATAGELRGTVLLPDGTPAAGADVSAAGMFVKPALRLQTTTDAKGQFRLELKPLSGAERWSVCARKGRMGGEANDPYGIVAVAAGQDPAPLVIRLVERGVVRGRVLQAEDNRPIAGANLFLDSGVVLTTDDEGRFTAGGLPLGNHSLIPVTQGRVRPYILFDTSLRPDAELELHLELGRALVGRVLDERGQPIEGAYLTRSSSGTALTLNGWDEVCNVDGTFRYDGISLNRRVYELTAGAVGHESAEQAQTIARRDEPLKEFTLTLKNKHPPRAAEAPAGDEPPAAKLPRRDLRGVVTSPNDTPVAGALVRWGATMYEATERKTHTDREGEFLLSDVPDRDGFVTVMADDLAPRFARVSQGEKRLSIRLEEGQVVRCVVRNKAGKPIENVNVVPVLPSPDPSLCNPLWLTERQARTDAEGRFEITGLPRSGTLFDILHPTYSEQRNTALKVGGEDNEIVLGASGAIRGIVLDPEGRPVRQFHIRIQIPRNLKPGEPAGGYYAGYDWYGILFTSEDGSFVVSDVPAGAWLRVHAIASGYGQAIIDRVQAAPLDELPPAEQLKLTLLAPHSLRVGVATELQTPVDGAQVTLIDDHPELDRRINWGYDDRHGLRGWTANDGQAVFTDLVFGEATVLVQHPDYASTRQGWRAGEKEVQVTLAPEAIIRGLVKLAGRPLDEFHVQLRSTAGDSHFRSVVPKDRGAFSLDQLPAGEYTLEIRDERRSLHKQVITLKFGETRQLAIAVAAEKTAE
jgi:hypothetical protein